MKIIFLFASFGVFLISCQRPIQNSPSKVLLNLPANLQSRQLNPNGATQPASTSDLNCYLIAVTGPEDALKKDVCQMKSTSQTFDVGLLFGGYYSGSTGTTLSFDVPSGIQRVFRLIGFQVNTSLVPAGTSVSDVCQKFISNDTYQTYMSDPYLISELKGVELKPGQTQQLDMVTSFSTSSIVGDCKGPDFPNGSGGSTSSPPAKVKAFFQDQVGSSSQPLRMFSCVGLKLQLQDANGNRAYMTSSDAISVKLKTIAASVSVGDFFAANDVSPCDSALKMNPDVNGDITIPFYNNSQSFSDFFLWFRPNVSATTFQISVTDIAGVLTPALLTYNYYGPTPTPTSYALYDMYNNTSTATASTTALPFFVRRNECRPGYLQLLDENKVPASKFISASSPDPVKIYDTGATGDISFYASRTDCLNDTTPNNALTVSFTSSTQFAGHGFYYKIKSTTLNQFSFSIQNVPGSSPVLSTGALNATANFWQTTN